MEGAPQGRPPFFWFTRVPRELFVGPAEQSGRSGGSAGGSVGESSPHLWVRDAALDHALRTAGVDSTPYVVLGADHRDIAVMGGEEKLRTTVPMMLIITEFLDRTICYQPGTTNPPSGRERVQSSDTSPT
jgi:hypothetical protein